MEQIQLQENRQKRKELESKLEQINYEQLELDN